MKIPRWYVWQCALWLVTGLPFQWFFTAFNGLPFLSLPDSPGLGGPSLGEWILAMIFLYHPVLTAPLALWKTVRHSPDGSER